MVNLKQGEEITRLCHRKRSETFTAIHDYTMYSDCFTADDRNDLPDHIKNLMMYLADALIDGMPDRPVSASQSAPDDNLKTWYQHFELVDMAKDAGYRGFGREQHPIVQRYLRYNDDKTIATEVPVYDDERNGFIDILRVHECHPVLGEWMIEISDFKPDAAKEKKASAQVDKYRKLLSFCANVPIDKIFCSYNDDTDGYIVVYPEFISMIDAFHNKE
jgi:hypothetical protein